MDQAAFDKLDLDTRGTPFGAWANERTCPACNGGDSGDKACSLMRLEDGGILYHCFRAKCGVTGVVRPERSTSRGAGAAAGPARPTPPAPPREPFVATRFQRELGPTLREYLVEQRGIPAEVLARNGVREATLKNRETGLAPTIVFTYFQGGKPVAEKLRALPKVFWQAKNGTSTLYGIDDLVGQDTVILTEGELDKLSVEAAGLLNAASLQNGASAGLPDEMPEALRAARKVVLAVDGDEAGQESAQALAEQLGEHRCWWVTWRDGCKDANEVLLKFGPGAVREDIDLAVQRPTEGVTWLDDHQDEYLNISRGEVPTELLSGYSTGWTSLDQLYRVVPGEVTIVTGVPGSGKSEWLLSLLVNLAKQNHQRAMIFSFETPRRSLVLQILEKYHDAPRDELLKQDNWDESLEESLQWMDQHFDFGSAPFDTPTIDGVLERAREEAESDRGLHALVIDPYNYLTRGDASKGLETLYISDIMSKLKRFANEARCHVWIVAHPAKSKSWTNTAPTLYDISGSSNWYNKCDMGIIIHRLVADLGDGVFTPVPFTRVTVEKVRNRNAGQTGEVILDFDYDARKFSEASLEQAEVAQRKAQEGKTKLPYRSS